MPINVTVTNSGKISLQETIIQILVFTLAASRLNSKVKFVVVVVEGHEFETRLKVEIF